MATKQFCKSRLEDLQTRSPEDFATKGWETKNKVPQKLKKLVEGRNISYLATVEIDSAKELEKTKPEDFMLENLDEIDAIRNLTEMQINPSTLLSVDAMEKGAGQELYRMEAAEWAETYIANNKQKEEPKKDKEEQ